MGLCDPWADTYLHNWKPTYLNQQKKLDGHGNIELKAVNQLMMTSETTQPEPYQRPSTNLRGNQSCMYNLDTANIKCYNPTEDMFQDQWNMIQ